MSRKVTFEFDPFDLTGEELPEGASKKEVLQNVADFVYDSVLDKVGSERSPVAGYGAFPKLTKDYKKFKEKEGHPGLPDLVFSGEMLDALKSKAKRSTIVIGITGKQGDKADGHNNHSGESTLPLRRFIPADGETFTRDILQGISRIIQAG